MSTLGYYPGCSMHGTAAEYSESLHEVARAMGTELQEIPGWVCCGASSAHSLDRSMALVLAGDNLLRARRAGMERVLAPCAMCYSRLVTTVHEAKESKALAGRLEETLGGQGVIEVEPLSLLDWLDGFGDEELRELVKRPLQGVKVACYYGCLLVRPGKVTGYQNPENPSSMERVLRLLGAEPVRWAMATECCGGSFSLSDKSVVLRQGRLLLDLAKQAGAEAVVVACPMCHSNLDMRQREFSDSQELTPVLYMTQLLGLAFGLPEASLGFRRHFAPVQPVLTRLAAAEAGSPKEG